MKKVLLAILLSVCIFIVTGCKSIDYGTVISKRYAHAHTSYKPYVIRIGNQTRIMPRWINHDDEWAILVENEDGKEWWVVSKSFYDSIDIGDTVDRREQR